MSRRAAAARGIAPGSQEPVGAPALTLSAWLRWDVVRGVLAAHLRAGPPGTVPRVLEVGCGTGAMGYRLGAGADYTGLEPDPGSAARARARMAALGRGRVLTGLPNEVLAATDAFDVVCAFEVLEHIADDDAALRDWVSRLRPGGLLALSVPAHPRRFSAVDEMVGHYRRYTSSELHERLRAAGLVEVSLVETGFVLGPALEWARLAYLATVGRRGSSATRARAPEARSAGSGRFLQPADRLAWATRVVSKPFRWSRSRLPGPSTGLVAFGYAPSCTAAASGAASPTSAAR